MATTLQVLIDQVRAHLVAPITTDLFWTDAELVAILNNGIKDLWKAINDDYQNYFLTVDITNVSLAASSNTLTGVPTNVGIVRNLEARDLSAYPYLKFEHRAWDHKDFVAARAQGTIESSNARLLYFDVTDAGSPVGAPTIRVAPKVSAALLLSLSYVPGLTTLTASGTNPIPGESDQALICWGVAYARAKEREDRAPDPAWIAIYEKVEKAKLLVSLTPRQTQDEEVAEALFEEYW